MGRRSSVISLALSHRTRDCSVLFQSGPGIKNVSSPSSEIRKIERKKKTHRDKFLFDLFEADCYPQGLVFQSRGLAKRGQASKTLDWLSWIRVERTWAHYQILSYIQSQNKLDRIRKGFSLTTRIQDHDSVSKYS